MSTETAALLFCSFVHRQVLSVLVVDDNEMNRMVAKKLLRDTRVQVELAESGARCLELTREHYYHVIFMDYMMPQMDGVETLQQLRQRKTRHRQ